MAERDEGPGKPQKPNPWPGIVSLAMMCISAVAIVYIIWG